jgi:predicted ABC-type ATPase
MPELFILAGPNSSEKTFTSETTLVAKTCTNLLHQANELGY